MEKNKLASYKFDELTKYNKHTHKHEVYYIR